MPPPPKTYWFHMKYWAYILPIAYFISFLFLVVPLLGVFKTIEDFGIDACTKISGPDDFKNCEDAVLSDETGVIYTTCEPDRLLYNKVMGFNLLAPGQKDKSGALWKVNYVETPAVIEKFEINKEFDATTDFHPLGINVDYHPITKAKTLVVINLPHHTPKDEALIEFFEVDDKNVKLTHKRTVQHPKIYSPNSIHILNDVRFRAADGTPSFFFSNDHYFSSGILKKLENYFFYLSNVGFYNARTGQVEKGVNGLLFANGLSGTDEILFVSETQKRHVKKFDIQVTTDKQGLPHITLNHVADTQFDFATDNLRYLPEKELLVVAGHPKGLDFLKYVTAPDKTGVQKPASQVDIWDLKTGETKTLMRDNGDFFTASSTGNIDIKNSKLIVSGLMEEGLLVCEV